MTYEFILIYSRGITRQMKERIYINFHLQIVPRKSEIFQEDIYPETAAPAPALTGKY